MTAPHTDNKSPIFYIISYRTFVHDGNITSKNASTRMRALKIAPHLVDLGHDVTIAPVKNAKTILNHSKIDKCIIVIAKSGVDLTTFSQKARALGAKVVMDVCDAQLIYISDHYPAMLANADAITTSSEILSDMVSHRLGLRSVVIPDCVEGSKGEARPPRPNHVHRFLWFGHGANVAPLIKSLPDLATFSRKIPFSLEVVTAPNPDLLDELKRFLDHLHVQVTPWSENAVWAALADCDVVLMPTLNTPQYLGKSTNRIQESLWAGRIPVAEQRPGLRDFTTSAVLAPTLVEGLHWLRNHNHEIGARLIRGQELVAGHFTPHKVALRWARLFADLES